MNDLIECFMFKKLKGLTLVLQVSCDTAALRPKKVSSLTEQAFRA